MTMHHVIRYGEACEIIGEAATESEARALFSIVHNVDFYDAEDGPRVARYEADGKGCFIVDGTPCADAGAASTLNNRPLSSIIAEFFTEAETKRVVYCDAGNGCAVGEAGRVLDYDPEKMADLIMTDIPAGEDRISDDGFESVTQSEWQDGANGYRWRVRF